MLAGMVGANGAGLSDAFAWQIPSSALAVLGIALVLQWAPAALAALTQVRGRRVARRAARLRGALSFAIAPLFVVGVLQAAARTTSPFLYFQF